MLLARSMAPVAANGGEFRSRKTVALGAGKFRPVRVAEEASRIHQPVKIQFRLGRIPGRQIPPMRAIPRRGRFKQVTADLDEIGISHAVRPDLVGDRILGREALALQANPGPVTPFDGDDAAGQIVRDASRRQHGWYSYRVAHGRLAERLAFRAMTARTRRDLLRTACTRKTNSNQDYPVQACQRTIQIISLAKKPWRQGWAELAVLNLAESSGRMLPHCARDAPAFGLK
jgi:hypothetical protein